MAGHSGSVPPANEIIKKLGENRVIRLVFNLNAHEWAQLVLDQQTRFITLTDIWQCSGTWK